MALGAVEEASCQQKMGDRRGRVVEPVLYLSTTAVGSTQFLGAPNVGSADFKSATIYLSSVAAGSVITYQINIATSSDVHFNCAAGNGCAVIGYMYSVSIRVSARRVGVVGARGFCVSVCQRPKTGVVGRCLYGKGWARRYAQKQ